MIVCNFFLSESLSPSVRAWEVGELLGADPQVCLVLGASRIMCLQFCAQF